ncbi:MAG: nuclear transport factor 2 family protein [Anaerolineales bacterium]
MSELLGKGYYLWQLPRCDDGDPARIAARAKAADLSHLMIKIADGGYWDYNVDKERNLDLVPPVLAALKAEGIQVWGWHYVRGDQPIVEAQRAIKRISELGVDGYVIDAELEYSERSKASAAGRFMEELRRQFPDLPIALSTYRYPRTHPALPYDEFLQACDYAMPQVYFEQAHNPEEQLQRAVDQYMDLKYARPVIPTAPTYKRGDWRPTPEEIQRLLGMAKESGLTAANAWSWDTATHPEYIDLFDAVGSFDWPTKPPIADMPERLIGRLNQHEPTHVANLYTDKAAHVTGERTVVGRAPVEAWYRRLFGQLLPEATFEVTGKMVDGPTRHFTWIASSSNGQVQNGNDTLRVLDGRIQYHYSYFSIQRSA